MCPLDPIYLGKLPYEKAKHHRLKKEATWEERKDC